VNGKVESSFTSAFCWKGKTMEDIILAMLEDVGFTVPSRESSLSEIIGTPSHLETPYEIEL